MMSTAAKREEIQLKLQELREKRDREQAAFDAVAAAHPEMSAQEIAALAHQQAAETVSRSLLVDGTEVCVGDRVTVKDDVQLLRRADRGFFGPDVLKPVYLGERGEVLRVMPSFQGKPAVELRFADGASRVFFTECIETDAARGGAGGGSPLVPRRDAGRANLADVPIFVPPTKAPPPPPKVETMPGWDQLAMPHRKPAGGLASGAAATAAFVPPPPPPSVSALRTREPPTLVASKGSKPSSSPPPSQPLQMSADVPTTTTTATKASAPPAKQQASSPIGKEVPAQVRGSASSATPDTSLALAQSSSSSSAIPIIKRPPIHASSSSSSPHASHHHSAALQSAAASLSHNDDDNVSAPLLHVETAELLVRAADGTEDAAAVSERQPTQSSSTAGKGTVTLQGAVAPAVREAEGHECDEEKSNGVADRQLPQACTTTAYQAKYMLQDDASRIPRRQSSTVSSGGTRTCWVCGLIKADAALSEPVRVAFQSQCTAMLSLFAVLTRKLQWDKSQSTASRLFTEKGIEIKAASAVRNGMRLVATTGCEYCPAAHPDAFTAVPETCPTPPPAPRLGDAAKRPEASTSSSSSSTPAAKKAPMVVQRKPSTGEAASAGAARSPKHSTRLPVSLSSSSNKPRHIRVYENGLYDDNIYHTVTVRPTYKTLTALKTTITRELQWRGGKKVDILFDACGAEISDLDAICDGDVVVASAGDRFVIPYPNTAMHLEAIKLSERLDPLRKC